MPENVEERSKYRVSLESAWEVLCDFGQPDSDRRASLKQARRVTQKCSVADSAQAFQQLASWERKIKYEFVWRIYDGDFDAFGIDISDGVSNSERLIPHRLFDQRVESFVIAWDENRLSVFGRTIVGIRIAPGESVLRRLELAKPTDTANPQFSPAKPADYPAPSGAKSYEDRREDAILELYGLHADFEDMTFEAKLEKVIALVGGDLAKRGFGRTAVYETIARLKSEGRISSDNVRKQKSSDRTNT
ncbi:MAG: hypothetical protein EOP84_04880 [Verrucomicrobiaceae bacterium]|nr:MAG: hypothetical protein EOP84_04880 [Verrucomicrobiaceae bacterium]